MGPCCPRVYHVVRAQWRQHPGAYRLLHAGGVSVRLSADPAAAPAADQVASLYHSFSNADLVAELKAVSEHLKLTSRLDGLTGIANRAHLDDSLARLASLPPCQAPLSLVLVDVDYFQFNDHLWSSGGDQCLQQVGLLAEVLRREDDLAARYGGEEFALLLAPPAGGHADRRAGAYLVASPRHSPPQIPGLRAGQLQLRVATLVPDQHHSIAELIQKADAALYQAKHNGRDRIEVALMGKDPAKTD